MNRKQINKEADKWLMADTHNRAQVIIMAENPDDPHLSFSAGGNGELLVQALCETLNKYPLFAAILADAIERYNANRVSQN